MLLYAEPPQINPSVSVKFLSVYEAHLSAVSVPLSVPAVARCLRAVPDGDVLAQLPPMTSMPPAHCARYATAPVMNNTTLRLGYFFL